MEMVGFVIWVIDLHLDIKAVQGGGTGSNELVSAIWGSWMNGFITRLDEWVMRSFRAKTCEKAMQAVARLPEDIL
ncbi:hypothetical protein Dda_1216 [Drechslerella dactyloides]|uniref:Uncharacterized protein n=1 Tax=Drechslerella dactyloides TaxID=74499 RepID=A0AAD6NMT3_DREDA|nr:hypothetical protein Dda_1216 [Drechslerella dactyloides]